MSFFDPSGYVLPSDAGHSVWFLDTRMTVKAGGEQTRGAFTFLEWVAPVGFAPPRHVHDEEDEAFYVLTGSLWVECGDRRWKAGRNTFVFLPHGIPHAFVVSDGPARKLQITSPAGFERCIDELGRRPESPGLPEPSPPDVPRLVEAAPRYGYEILGPPLSLSDVAAGE